MFGKENFTWANFELNHWPSLNNFMYLVILHQNKNFEHFLRFYTSKKYQKNQFRLHSSDLLEPGSFYLGRSFMKAFKLTSVLTRHTFLQLNRYKLQKLSSTFLKQGLQKDCRHFKPIQILQMLKRLATRPSTMVRPLQLHSSTQQLYIPLLRHCYKTGRALLTSKKYIFIWSCYDFFSWFFSL